MTTISDLKCIGKNGKPIYGTAAILHRLFANDEEEYDREADFKRCNEIIKECGYGNFDD